MTEIAQQSQADSLATQVARLTGVIGSPHYPSGDRAALRRWAPGQPLPLAFYRLWLRHLDAELPPPAQLEGWVALTWAIATLGADAHAPKRPLGQALAESQFAEGRLERLLSAPDDVRLELFMSAVRFLAAKGERFDLTEAARFLLTHDADKREALHRRIASAYYRHAKDSQS
jgi:CRISPR system Cascade subunit CasB